MLSLSRPAWLPVFSGGNGVRRSPVEIVASMGTFLFSTPVAGLSGLRTGPFGRWADGVTAMRADCATFADHWRAHNAQVLRGPGPLWVVLGDSTAQGLGALDPDGGYVGQTLAVLKRRTGLPWRVLNLSASGALIRNVLSDQLSRMPASYDLITCGIGANDILYTAPGRLFGEMRELVGAVPEGTVLLDLPVPSGVWGFVGRASAPYVTRVNRVLHQSAAARGLPVAAVSTAFTPPWTGKFASDRFHPSQLGYRDWTRALLAALPGWPGVPAPGVSYDPHERLR